MNLHLFMCNIKLKNNLNIKWVYIVDNFFVRLTVDVPFIAV